MDSENLREQLAKLHAELALADHVDPALRDLAADVMNDIARLVAAPRSTAAPPSGAAQPSGATQPSTAASPSAASPPSGARQSSAGNAVDRLDALTVQFEVAHPAVAASLRRLVDLLGEVGL